MPWEPTLEDLLAEVERRCDLNREAFGEDRGHVVIPTAGARELVEAAREAIANEEPPGAPPEVRDALVREMARKIDEDMMSWFGDYGEAIRESADR